MFPDVHTDLRRIAQGIEPRIEKAHPAAAEWGFPVSSLSSRLVWSQLRQTLYQANESAKSPSPSLAGQSVIVNQAGLLAPVHRSSAPSQGSLPSDCQPPSAYGITRCYSGVTAPAYTGFPIKQTAILSYSLHLIQYIFSFYVTIG